MSQLRPQQLPLTSVAASCASQPQLKCALGEPQYFPDRSGVVGAVAVVRCSRCGIGITTPQLDDVAFLYESRESQDFQPLSFGLARAIKAIAFRREARSLLKQIGRMPKRVLDFGCGNGLFTRCLGDALPAGSVVGTDFHPSPPVELQDRPYVSNDEFSRDPQNFDLIIARHVIEHDDNPRRVLRKLKDLSNDDCIFVFEVPNVDCFWAPIFGRSWDAWYLPFHRVHFTRTSLRGVLECEGFEIVREFDVSIPSMGRSIANARGAQNSLALLLLGAMLYPFQWVAELVSRRPSALRVIARINNSLR